ncbi:amino-acid acetyltransferase [Salix suchowensis]|nr:amino-acid acetyltransferase [Salix suchowensis]
MVTPYSIHCLSLQNHHLLPFLSAKPLFFASKNLHVENPPRKFSSFLSSSSSSDEGDRRKSGSIEEGYNSVEDRQFVKCPFLDSILKSQELMSKLTVKKVYVIRMRERLDGGCIVVLSNLVYSISGEVLNCNTYEVATASALAIGTDKLICIIDGPILDESGHLIRFLTLDEADMLIRKQAKQSEIAAHYVKAVGEEDHTFLEHNDSVGIVASPQNGKSLSGRNNATFHNGVGFDNGNALWSGEQGMAAAAFVCKGGVQRVHLLDSTVDGVLLLELFKRDGMGTMVASDLYEGTRMARATDLARIRQIIQPLEQSGTLVRRTDEEHWIPFVVVEREGQIIACAALFPFFEEKCGEVAAIAVSPKCRDKGREINYLPYGQTFADFIERKASSLGLETLFLLTTRTADWYCITFHPLMCCMKCSIQLIPDERRKKINVSRNSKYYTKKLLPVTYIFLFELLFFNTRQREKNEIIDY